MTLPEWQLEPDDEAYFGQPDNGIPTIDADGQVTQPAGGAVGDSSAPAPDQSGPAVQIHRGADSDEDWRGPPPPPQPQGPPQQQQPGQRLDQHWLDNVLGRNPRGSPPPRSGGQSPQPTQ